MSFFNFRNQNKFEDIARILSNNESASRARLHEKHPHVAPLLQKHGIDLAKIREHGAKVTTSAAILGALLAFPHLVHAPTQHQLPVNQGTFQTKVLSDTSNSPVNTSTGQGIHHIQTPSQLASPNNATTTPTKPTDNDNDETSNHEQDDHEHGRSGLAPPKEHGLHDLGYHEGAERNPDKVSSPGSHPEETIEHGKGET